MVSPTMKKSPPSASKSSRARHSSSTRNHSKSDISAPPKKTRSGLRSSPLKNKATRDSLSPPTAEYKPDLLPSAISDTDLALPPTQPGSELLSPPQQPQVKDAASSVLLEPKRLDLPPTPKPSQLELPSPGHTKQQEPGLPTSISRPNQSDLPTPPRPSQPDAVSLTKQKPASFSSPIKKLNALTSPKKPVTTIPHPPIAGNKRPAPSLLPPFAPLSSSPDFFPRPAKRAKGTSHPNVSPLAATRSSDVRSPFRFMRNSVSQPSPFCKKRAPLGSVPVIRLPDDGEYVSLGRSSSFSHYQLPSDMRISRLHVKARYLAFSCLSAAASSSSSSAETVAGVPRVEVMCTGSNGIKVHCQARTWELAKGDTFILEDENTELMLDIAGAARVRLLWPVKPQNIIHGNMGGDYDGWEEDGQYETPSPYRSGDESTLLWPATMERIAMPKSPCPANNPPPADLFPNSDSDDAYDYDDEAALDLLRGLGSDQEIHIYEDPPECDVTTYASATATATTIATSTAAAVVVESKEVLDDGNMYYFRDDATYLSAPDENIENEPIGCLFGPLSEVGLSERMGSINRNSLRTSSILRARLRAAKAQSV